MPYDRRPARNGDDMGTPEYTYPSDDEVLAQFITEHIEKHHTVEAGSNNTLVCVTCNRIARTYSRNAVSVLREHRHRS